MRLRPAPCSGDRTRSLLASISTLQLVLRKHPSLNAQRNLNVLYAIPYLLRDGTLDECIKEFMSKPASQHSLYEIHTEPQPPLVTEVLSAEHIVELARLRDFL
jgi:hypothetical protein